MICLRCGHYTNPDSEMARVQDSNKCPCFCHRAEKNERYARQYGASEQTIRNIRKAREVKTGEAN